MEQYLTAMERGGREIGRQTVREGGREREVGEVNRVKEREKESVKERETVYE